MIWNHVLLIFSLMYVFLVIVNPLIFLRMNTTFSQRGPASSGPVAASSRPTPGVPIRTPTVLPTQSNVCFSRIYEPLDIPAAEQAFHWV